MPHQKVLCPITQSLIGSFQTNHPTVTVLRGVNAANHVETDGRAAKQPVHRPRQHQVLGRPAQHLAFLRHQPQAVGHGQGLIHIVRGKQNGLPFFHRQLPEQTHHFHTAFHIQKSRRLIQENQRTFLHQCFGYHGFLTLSIGQFGHITTCLSNHTDLFQRPPYQGFVGRSQTAEKTSVRLTPQSHQFVNGQPACLHAVGQYHTDGFGTLMRTVSLQRPPHEFQTAGQRGLHAGQRTQQSGLSGSIAS